MPAITLPITCSNGQGAWSRSSSDSVVEDEVLALFFSVDELPESTKTVISVLSVVSCSEFDMTTLTDSHTLPMYGQ